MIGAGAPIRIGGDPKLAPNDVLPAARAGDYAETDADVDPAVSASPSCARELISSFR
jgi:hypothetical protein